MRKRLKRLEVEQMRTVIKWSEMRLYKLLHPVDVCLH